MASIYSQIEETIRKAQEEIKHLEQERMALRRKEYAKRKLYQWR